MKLKTTILWVLLTTSLTFAKDNFDHKPKSLIKASQNLWKSQAMTFQSFKYDTLTKSDSLKMLFTILRNKDTVGYSYNGRVNSCRQDGCFNIGNSTNQSFEYFNYFVIYDLTLKIKKVKVYNYQSSHGYEICSKRWLAQFESLPPDQPINYGKEIDAISGATISAKNLIEDLQKISKKLTKILHQ